MSRLGVFLLCVLCVFAAVEGAKHAKKSQKGHVNWSKPAVDHDIIHAVNSDPSSTWEAGINSKFRNMKLSDVKALLGVKITHKWIKKPSDGEVDGDLPTEFDARTEWGKTCPSLSEVRDQSDCGSCWAFGAAEAMTDRVCIAFDGAKKPHLSATDLLACCGEECGEGCDGGDPWAAWQYWMDTGLVSGGNYQNSTKANGCFPYPLPPCEHHVNGTHYPKCPSTEYSTPECPNKCDAASKLDWDTDKVKGVGEVYSPGSVDAIKTDLYTYGPLEVAFDVYEDFLTYKSGVYQHKTGNYLGGHAVKLLGWGVENNVKYWTIMNSWNEDWGDNGQFKIKAGSNECGIESEVVGGHAK